MALDPKEFDYRFRKDQCEYWENQYMSRQMPVSNGRDRALLDRYMELKRMAEYVCYNNGTHSVDECIGALAMIDLQNEIHDMRKDTFTMHSQLMDQLQKTRSVERIVNNERVVVGDPINQLMSEVYKK